MRTAFSHITAGLVAVVVGVTSTIVLIIQAATAAGATPEEVSSWLLAVGLGVGVSCIGLSYYYRTPILTAWSTPGAALLITSLQGTSMPEAIGAFIFSAILIIFSGMTGLFEKTMNLIPRSLVSAMLAGILFHFGTNIFMSMQHQFLLVSGMFVTYLIGKQLFPRFVILLVLILGILIAGIQELLHLNNFHIALSHPLFTMPVFSLPTLISVGLPLFIVTMTSQNIPGIAIIHASEYRPAISPLISWTGLTNLLLAPFGGFAFNLAVITAAICLSKEAGLDSGKRYKAAMYGGVFYLIVGLFSATIVLLFTALPTELVWTVAGLALLSTLSASLKNAFENEKQQESSLITLLISASGISWFGIGAPFWGLTIGMLCFALLSSYKNTNFVSIKNMFSLTKKATIQDL